MPRLKGCLKLQKRHKKKNISSIRGSIVYFFFKTRESSSLNPNLGRKSKDDITVCDLTGTGVQDTAIARHTFNIALNKKLGR